MTCKYCDGTKTQLDLKDEKDTSIYIDTDEKKLCFEHTEVFCTSMNIEDAVEDTLYEEIFIKYCPECGGEI